MSGQVSGEEEEAAAALLPVGRPLTASAKSPREELEEGRDEGGKEDEVPGAVDVTLPWPGDRDKKGQDTDGVSSGVCVSDEDDAPGKAKWRESMPEGDKWRDDLHGASPDNGGDGSLADDEEEDKNAEKEEEDESYWVPEKGTTGFTPQVKIVQRQSSEALTNDSKLDMEDRHDYGKENAGESQTGPHFDHDDWNWKDSRHRNYLCNEICNEKLKLALWTAAAALVFPFLVWGGYALLPFDSPLMGSAPHRVVYTLRCAVFASVPILLGVVVQGVARIRYGDVKPIFESEERNAKVSVHGHFVSQSVGLFLFYFLQLAVLASYVSHDLMKLVPLLTVIFVFGRLIYWLCLSLGSGARGLGFGLSFFPTLVMLAANLYFVSSSAGPDAVFDAEPPVTAPPPQQRSWWG
ncbi:transmembrane protein 79 [Syngnathoides biaculeatus]|uniref:transmembrane protein 79 n=1 Tax=Syngnathoides biaculeatus TaxID=300417 RepID=UPI002ADE6FAC|nr:transmembrane protein 79 [Syngnathoides biaculeatus]